MKHRSTEAAFLKFNRGHFREAIRLLLPIIQLEPKNFDAHFLLGSALQKLGEHGAALKVLALARSLHPDHAGLLNNVGLSSLALGYAHEAAESFRRALALEPCLAESWANLGNALRLAGRIGEASAAIRQALALSSNPEFNRLLILNLLYDPEVSRDELFAEQLEYVRKFAQPLYHSLDPLPRRLSEKSRIRVGYVSSDFRDHPVAHNWGPLILNHDPERFEVFLYADVVSIDAMTDRFQKTVEHWIPTIGLTDEELALRIRSDQIDLLVILAGHLDRNRLMLAARKPAPVLISMGDVATSAMETVDYWFTDSLLHPAKATVEPFTEQLVRLSHLYCYLPPSDSPEPGPPPFNRTGRVTFGSFNNPAKMNDRVIALWSRVLLAAPSTKLLLAYQSVFSATSARTYFLERFARNGVSADRIEFLSGNTNRHEHLLRYRQVDAALDTFPFNGATTTFESLWMGVPVITVQGDRFISRAAGSICVLAGLSEVVCEDEDSFVRRASDLESLQRLSRSCRDTLRSRILRSPLCDSQGYAREIESHFSSIIRNGD